MHSHLMDRACAFLKRSSGCVTLTTSGNAVTGATIGIANNGYHESPFALNIGPSGDSFSEVTAFDGYYGCGYSGNQTGTFTYVGNGSLCSMNVSNPTAGVWTVVPEIDTTSAASGLTLLFGSLLVLHGRRLKGSVTK